MLSKPKGERLSAKAAMKAAHNAANTALRIGKAYKREKYSKLKERLRKLARNMAIEPSRLFLVKIR